MSNIALPHSDLTPTAPATSTVVTAVLILWFAAIVFLGATGALVTPANQPPLRMLLAALAPLTVFFAAFWMSRSFRTLIAAADLRVVASIQAWRFGGFVFLILYAYGILPGLFALPAGLGDMAVGITAPWIVLSLNRPWRAGLARGGGGGEPGRSKFPARHQASRRDYYRSDGAAAARADTRVLRADPHHAALRCASSEPEAAMKDAFLSGPIA